MIIKATKNCSGTSRIGRRFVSLVTHVRLPGKTLDPTGWGGDFQGKRGFVRDRHLKRIFARLPVFRFFTFLFFYLCVFFTLIFFRRPRMAGDVAIFEPLLKGANGNRAQIVRNGWRLETTRVAAVFRYT